MTKGRLSSEAAAPSPRTAEPARASLIAEVSELARGASVGRPTVIMKITPIAVFARAAIKTSGGEALTDATLQLGVAACRKQELGGHPAGVVLGPTSIGAGICFRRVTIDQGEE